MVKSARVEVNSPEQVITSAANVRAEILPNDWIELRIRRPKIEDARLKGRTMYEQPEEFV